MIYIQNLIYTVNYVRNSLEKKESVILQLKKEVEKHRKYIDQQIKATIDMQKQLMDQNREAINSTKQIEEIYECLELLDNRILEIAKLEKKKK